MNLLKSIFLAFAIGLLSASHSYSQSNGIELDSIGGVESYGFLVNEVVKGSEAAGIQSIRWKIATAEMETKMLNERIAKLNKKYESYSKQQQELKKEMFRFGLTGPVEDKLREINFRIEDLSNELTAMNAERNSLALRLKFEMESQASDRELAAKQHEVVMSMLKLQKLELEKTRKLRDSGTISAQEVNRAENDLKEMELRGFSSKQELERESAAVRDIQLAMAETQERLNASETQIVALKNQRDEISERQVILGAEPQLQFDQQLMQKMIETYSLRTLDLELESIRLKALLSMVEGKLQENKTDPEPTADE